MFIFHLILCYFGSLFVWQIVTRTTFVFCRYCNFLLGLWPLASQNRVALIIICALLLITEAIMVSNLDGTSKTDT